MVVLQRGGVIVFPTTGLYGLGVDALNDRAIKKVFEIKARPRNNPIPIVIKDALQLTGIVTHIPQAAKQIINQYWPGKMTLVFQAQEHLSRHLTADTGKIGVRQPRHPVAVDLVDHFHSPITATSANISGCPGISRISDLDLSIRRKVDLILDAGPLKGGIGSSVCDATTDPPTLLREGTISPDDILKSINIKVRKIIDNPH